MGWLENLREGLKFGIASGAMGGSADPVPPNPNPSTRGSLAGYAALATGEETPFPMPSIALSAIEAGAGAATEEGGSDQASRVASKLGISTGQASTIINAANRGDANAIATLRAIGEWAAVTSGGSSGGGGSRASGGGSSGGGGSAGLTGDPAYDRLVWQNRQLGALFDPNYADGALITLPDGTTRINGTEIILDMRTRGQYKPVQGAPGYLVDPVTSDIIDTNGHQIRREELSEAIRTNYAQEGIAGRRLDLDTELGRFDSDLNAELGRGRLALDTTLGVGGLNLDAATAENDFALRNGLGTNQLNLDSFLGTGNLNVNATNAETNRFNALSQRAASAGQLASEAQRLQDARTFAVIQMAANPQDFVEREMATRGILAPPGYTGPAFKDDPRISSIIDKLMTDPDVSGLLPTFVAPQFSPVALPNARLPRVTAPAAQPAAVRTPVTTPQAPLPARDISGGAYTNTTIAPQNQAASTAFRAQGVPDWALAPLGYAQGTEGTREGEFIVGDPQASGLPNPELVEIHNPGPNTTTEVTPLRGMVPDEIVLGRETPEFAFGSSITRPRKPIAPTRPDDEEGPGEIIRDAFENVPLEYLLYDMMRHLARRQREAAGKTPAELQWEQDLNPGDLIPNWDENNRKNPQEGWWNWGGHLDNPAPLPNSPWHSSDDQNSPTWNPNHAALAPEEDPFAKRRLMGFAYGTGYGTTAQDQSRNFALPDNTAYQNAPGYIAPPNRPAPALAPADLPMNLGGGNTSSTAQNPLYNNGPNLGPRDSQGNFLGQLTSYNDQQIAGMPNVRYAQDIGNAQEYDRLNTGLINGPFGLRLPDVGGLNYQQLLNLQSDPDSWGVLSSIYSAANRNLGGLFNRVRERAPIGQILDRSLIRT